jgi:hypothetical protein
MNIYASSILWHNVLDRAQMTVTLLNALKAAVERGGTGLGVSQRIVDGWELHFEDEHSGNAKSRFASLNISACGHPLLSAMPRP